MMWYNKNIWSLSLDPGTQFLEPLESMELEDCFYVNEKTGGGG